MELKAEDDLYEESDKSGDNHECSQLEDSIRHLRNVRSRDFSSSTTRGHNNILKRDPSNNGVIFSGMPSNSVIQETLMKATNNKISRKDYSKRTRVSVLDSSLSSLMKNSATGDNQLLENQNKDPNIKGKSISSGESKKNNYYSNTNPRFQFHKFKDLHQGFQNKNFMRKIYMPELNSPREGESNHRQTPKTQQKEFGRDLNITRKFLY